MSVQLSLKRMIWTGTIAVSMCIGMAGSAAQVAAYPVPQDQRDHDAQSQDYSKNKNYQQGLKDGRDDMAHNRDHYKKRKFKKDQDQKDYEAGYQAGRQNNSPDHR